MSLLLLFGQAASSNYTLTAASGSFAITGTAATLQYGRKIVAASGAYTLTGTAADIRYDRLLIAASGSYAITGTAANLVYDVGAPPQVFTLTASSGAFVLTGTDATLQYSRRIIAESGEFAITGTAATLFEFTPPPKRRKHGRTFASTRTRSMAPRWMRVRKS